MDKDLRARLDKVLHKQAEIQEDLHQLGQECQTIRDELNRLPQPTQPPPLPSQSAIVENPATNKATPRQVNHVLPAEPINAPVAAQTTAEALRVTPEKNTPPQRIPTKKTALNTGEWELNFGRIWLVRIGVLLLLTGLIFLSTYAYKNWLFNTGPAVKVTFFMAVSLTLTCVGMWLDHWKERFRQYGRVVASGGLAAGYYTIYASHFVPALKLTQSTLLAGILLTLWAGIILAYAVWKKSRVVAVLAIGLAFYGSIVNPSGCLSLFSALLLSSAGMWLMIKFRWTAIGLGTVVAAYAAHAFWLGFYPQSTSESVRFTYLACYWLLFIAALTVHKARVMPEQIQRAFCAINNGAAWSLAVFTIPRMIPHEEIGWISIGVGALFLVIATVARTGELWNRSLAAVFGYQGVLIASLGVLLEATGYTRFLVMAVEACILLAGARYFGGTLARAVSAVAFSCALITAFPEMNGGNLAPWPSYAALALVCAIYTALVRHDGTRTNISSDIQKTEPNMTPMLPASITWVVAAFGIFNQWQYSSGINGLWITATAVMMTHFVIKNPRWRRWICDLAEITTFAALAGAWWYLTGSPALGIHQSILPLIGTAAFWFMSPQLTQVWDQLTGNKTKPDSKALEWIFSVLFWVMLAATLNQHMKSDATWMIAGGVLALSGNAIAKLTRRNSIGKPALCFHLGALISLADHGNQESAIGWIPALLLFIHLVLVDTRWKTSRHNHLHQLFSLGLVIAVCIHAFQEFDRPDITLTLFGLVMMAWAYHRKNTGFAIAGGIPPLIIACVSTIIIHASQDWLRYFPIAATLPVHALLWRKTHDNQSWQLTRSLVLCAGLASLFFSSSMHVQQSFNGSGLAICWALLATLLFCAGLVIRCRPYRLIGLYWLAAAVLHVVFIDVMQMDTLGRILSFIVLGLILLTLGFLYNRFQEIIRKFL
ncbi:MAG: DUF2339 domain-containing protein [Verrucomicrobiae bacterium]|nr:DUF2339 domain-containing protein [Verrucomicrobiae bacterium]NNJ44145.1 DUF2339 domain-containing protein [Akkermansiaceae bacterium]